MFKKINYRVVAVQGHNVMHLVYFAAVFAEAHGFYGQAAGVLFVMGVCSILFGEGNV